MLQAVATIAVGAVLVALNPLGILIRPKRLRVAEKGAIGKKKAYEFSEVGVVTETVETIGNSWSYTGYSAIVGVYEAKKVFYLYTASRQVLIISKDGIELGSADELRALLLRHIPRDRYFTGWL